MKMINSIKRQAVTTSVVGRLLLTTGLLIPALLLLAPGYSAAQPTNSSVVAETISVADPEVAYGDLILYDSETDLYRRSQFVNDPRFFGVAIEDPALLIETDEDLVPVAQSGRVLVNVTLENGEITVGTPMTTSSTPGMAMRASAGHENVFGFAVESLNAEKGVVEETEEGETVTVGTIVVEVGGPRLQAFQEEREQEELITEEDEDGELTGIVIARYSLSAVIALASIFVTFYTFLSSIRSGVVSIGRNPRAKSAIRSMVVLNVILALLITTIGIFFAISLLVLPE